MATWLKLRLTTDILQPSFKNNWQNFVSAFCRHFEGFPPLLRLTFPFLRNHLRQNCWKSGVENLNPILRSFLQFLVCYDKNLEHAIRFLPKKRFLFSLTHFSPYISKQLKLLHGILFIPLFLSLQSKVISLLKNLWLILCVVSYDRIS